MTTTVRTRLAWAPRILGAALMVTGVTGMRATPSSAQDVSSAAFTVTADSQVASVRVTLPSAGLVIGEEVANVAPARATSRVDSFGTSGASAAAGYPGDTLVSLPGTVIGIASGFNGARDLVPLLPPIPSFPLIVQTDALNPKASNQTGVFSLNASTTGNKSAGDADVGVDTSGVTIGSLHASSDTGFDGVTGTATAKAVSEVNGLRLGNLIDMSQRTTGTATLASGGKPDFKTSSFFGISLVGGQVRLGFGPDGFEALGKTALDKATLTTVLNVLSSAGITVDYVPESRSADGKSVTSAGLRVTRTDSARNLVVATTLGKVTLSVDGSTIPKQTFGGGETAPGSTGRSTVSDFPSTGSASSNLSVPAIGVAQLPSSPEPRIAAPTAPASATRRAQPTLSADGLYLVLAGAALAALGSSRLLGLLAIRLRLGY